MIQERMVDQEKQVPKVIKDDRYVCAVCVCVCAWVHACVYNIHFLVMLDVCCAL